MIKNLVTSAHPRQWYKNVLLFVGLVFSRNLGDMPMVLIASLAFVCFCGLSASEYLINDIVDRNRNGNHQVKCRRPISWLQGE